MIKYEYIIYKVYNWMQKRKRATPVFSTVAILALAHVLQIFIILNIIDRFIVDIGRFIYVNDLVVRVESMLFLFIYYHVVYNKKRWESYMEKYGNETEAERKRGNRMVLLYLIGSIVLFFLSFPIIYSIPKR